MCKITYHYSALSKQAWFYAGILYLLLTSLVYILVAAYKVEGYYEQLNLPLILAANFIGMIFSFSCPWGIWYVTRNMTKKR